MEIQLVIKIFNNLIDFLINMTMKNNCLGIVIKK